MAAHGINAVRTYTVPPRWLLDLASEHGLFVMVGLAWEQHVAFLEDRQVRDRSRPGSRRGRDCAATPRSRLRGRQRDSGLDRAMAWPPAVERFLDRLAAAFVRGSDRARHLCELSVDGVPPTPVPRLLCFNVYLESRERARGLPRAAPEPCRRPPAGPHRAWTGQPPPWRGGAGRVLDGRFARHLPAGCAGRSSSPGPTSGTAAARRRDWGFGLTDASRQPKPALGAVR